MTNLERAQLREEFINQFARVSVPCDFHYVDALLQWWHEDYIPFDVCQNAIPFAVEQYERKRKLKGEVIDG